jgi:hypothetical protein
VATVKAATNPADAMSLVMDISGSETNLEQQICQKNDTGSQDIPLNRVSALA